MAGRFQLDVSDKDIEDIVNMIQTGQSTLIDNVSDSLRVRTHQIEFKGYTINIPYDKQRKMPITALYEDEVWDEFMYGNI